MAVGKCYYISHYVDPGLCFTEMSQDDYYGVTLKGIVVFCEDCVCLLPCVCFCINDSASPQTISPMKSHELKLNLSDLVKKKRCADPAGPVLTELTCFTRARPHMKNLLDGRFC